MTDLEKFIELYKSVGIELEAKPIKSTDDDIDIIEGYTLELAAKVTPGIVGYAGFSTDIIFDVDGKFVEQAVWE